jgi:hypothetical protein
VRRVLVVLPILGALVLGSVASAQVVNEVYPVGPEDRETVGPRAHFRVGVDGEDLYKIRFKIVLSQDDFETEAYVFDQLEDSNGWAFEDWDGPGGDSAHGAIYMTRKPIADGEYDWKVFAWNGVNWVEGDDVYRVYIDGIRPEPVEIYLGHAGEGAVWIEWDPVMRDIDGNHEDVSRYHVYRWTSKQVHMMMSMWEVGRTEELDYVDDSEQGRSGSLLFYKVTAEDLAGNHERFQLKVDESGEDIIERNKRRIEENNQRRRR